MRTSLLALLALTVLVAWPATPALATAPKKNAPVTDERFVEQASGRSLAGIELSALALQRSENAAIRRLAQRTHDESVRTLDALLGIATGAGATASPPETLDLEQRGIKSRLATLRGAEFDRAYVQALRTNDDRDIALYRTYAETGKDPALKSWVADQLTAIRKRRQLIDTAAREIR